MPFFDNSAFANPNPGVVTFSWGNFLGQGVSIADGEVLFEICFDVVGAIGESTDIVFGDAPTVIEVINEAGSTLGFIGNDGTVNISNDVLFVTLEQDSITCPSFTDGGFTVTVAGGTAPYEYSWNTVPPSGADNGPIVIPVANGSSTVDNLAAGFYQVTIEDSNNPMNVVVDTIEVLSGPILGVSIDDQIPSCFGGDDGSVLAEITLDGIFQPNPGNDFTFAWNIVGETGQSIDGITFGFYSVTVTDQSGCEATASTSVGQPPQLRVLPDDADIDDASCSGSMDGTITIMPTGGTTAGDYTFQWDHLVNPETGPTSTLTDLDPGTYCVTVTDDNGCEFMDCFTVSAVKTLFINSIVNQISCNSVCDGEINVTGSTTGAAEELPYTFTWSSSATPPLNTPTSSTLTDLCPGTYFLTMADADPNGCLRYRFL